MTLSVLIPIYQEDVNALVNELFIQLSSSNISFEIRCLDDHSDKKYRELNSQVVQDKRIEIHYRELGTNIGRSAIRNQLAAEAQGEFLWFLDCDADASVNAELAKNFIDRMQKGELLSGGRIYQKQPPADATKYLHWLWCSERELIDPVKRMSDPVNNFLSNNFVVHSEDFRQVQFDTTFSGYGYEDTFFAYELLSKGVNIVHIHNPVEHTGLESKDQFLLKIGQSLNNLILLRQICMQRGIAFPVKSKLVYWYQWFRRPMIYPFAWVFTLLLLPICQWQLRQKRPSLFILDLYRLTMLMKIS